jgi:hypothetical protein
MNTGQFAWETHAVEISQEILEAVAKSWIDAT